MTTQIAPLGTPEVMALASITPAAKNPRKITGKAVEVTAKSIKRFGWQQPIVVDRNHVIIAGHTRYQAALHLGLKNAPVIVASHLTPAEADAYRIADNRTSDYTTWDFPELVDQLEELSTDFADELGLADWQGILADFDAMNEDTGAETTDELTDLAVGAETADALNMEHSLTVVCRTEEGKLTIEGMLAEREEVIDVRHKR
ncbi:ParB N-terminal domain-containing protein [Corynebacterium phoceense]|uniref:ParB N-terminal domain-containing protein n=1 Tax=Corynebacterium phoceense TaxID=1686286 RepID=UPI001E5799B9|nr:ParB N-terminal domain-containing protein [Corynebacterium phoceense]